MNASLRRQEAPVLCIPKLAEEQVVFLLSGLIPNRKGHPLIHEWFGVVFDHEKMIATWSFDELIRHTELGKKNIANIGGIAEMQKVQMLLSRAILRGRKYLSQKQHEFEEHTKPELAEQIAALIRLKDSHFQQLELDFQGEITTLAMRRKESKQRTAEKNFAEYQQWIADTMTAEDNPYIQVVAVLKGGR